MKNILITGLAALSLAACGAAEEAVKDSGDAMKDAGAATVETTKKMADYVAPDILPAKFDGAAAGTYKVEKTHAFLTASVSHGGLSDYRMDFTDFDASLTFDPASASGMSIEFSVNPASVKTHYSGDYKAGHANSGFDTWDEQLGLSDKLLNAGKFPKATFTSNKVKRTGDYTAKVSGDMTFLGVSKPVTFHTTYNGVANKPWYGEMDLIGFNAETTISRSEFGLTAMKSGIGDEVTISFSGEFLQTE